MKNSGPITVNGIHPTSAPKVKKVGQAGSAHESKPKQSQVTAAGAKPGSGAPNTGSIASRIYPETLGLRGAKP